MKIPKKYSNAFHKLQENLVPICDKYNKSKLYFLLNAAYCNIRYGVTPNEYVNFEFYKLSALERRQYYTAHHARKCEPMFNPIEYRAIFDNKPQTLQYFSDLIQRRWLDTEKASLEEIKDFIDSVKRVIVKPTNLSSGRGIFILKEEPLEELKEGKYLLEEFIEQHPDISKLNPAMVNSIRIYTLKIDDGYQIVESLIRVGGENAEVDNFHAGGVAYPIDSTSGVVCGKGYDINGKDYIFHPSTGEQVVGFVLPNWGGVLRYLEKLVNKMPMCRLIAWDIAITTNGFDLIEANVDGDPNIMQSLTKVGKKRMLLSEL